MADESAPPAAPPETQPPAPTAPAAPPAAEPTSPPQADAPTRPEHVPEKFWDAEKGEVRVEAALKSYSELEKRNSGLRQAHRAEYEKEVFGARPEKAEGYEVKAPEKAPDGLVFLEKFEPGMQFEEGKTYFVPDMSDPLWGEVRGIAHRAGLSQAEFSEKVLPLIARVAGVRVPTAEERETANREFVRSLGENGDLRADHVRGWVRGQIGADRAEALLGNVRSKAAVEALEELMVSSGGARFSNTTAGAAAARQTEQELRAMMRDPRYQSDPTYQAEVSAGWRRLYGGQDAGVPAPFARAS